MKIDLQGFTGNFYTELRNAGYHPDKNQKRGSESFSRSLLGDRYPRFHIYLSREKGVIDLHLDHKAPKYKNAPDHGAEYEGKLVKEEAERIKKHFNKDVT